MSHRQPEASSPLKCRHQQIVDTEGNRLPGMWESLEVQERGSGGAWQQAGLGFTLALLLWVSRTASWCLGTSFSAPKKSEQKYHSGLQATWTQTIRLVCRYNPASRAFLTHHWCCIDNVSATERWMVLPCRADNMRVAHENPSQPLSPASDTWQGPTRCLYPAMSPCTLFPPHQDWGSRGCELISRRMSHLLAHSQKTWTFSPQLTPSVGEAGGAGKAKRHPSPVQSKVARLRLEPGVREVILLCSPLLLWTQSFLGIFSSRWFPWVTVKCRHTSLPLSWEVGAQGQSAPRMVILGPLVHALVWLSHRVSERQSPGLKVYLWKPYPKPRKPTGGPRIIWRLMPLHLCFSPAKSLGWRRGVLKVD